MKFYIFLQQKQILEGTLPESAAALEKKYNSVKKATEDLEAKLKKAKSLRNKISNLKSGNEFLSQNDLRQLDLDVSAKTSEIEASLAADAEIMGYEEKIAEIKSSSRFLSPTDKVQKRNQIEAMQQSISKAQIVQEEILNAEKDPGFCSDIETLQNQLNFAQDVFKRLQSGKL
jgi:hypothetical protein